ncbi:MAG: hypothetical protein ACI92N_003267 [Pseudomonadales bacterium]|jgi:hypothetical protein
MALAEANPRGGGSPLVGSHNVYRVSIPMKKYRSDVKNPKVLKLLALGSIFLLGAVVFGQIKGDRFPVYTDIIIAPLLAVGLYAILWVLAILMPITVKPEGIKCYNARGRYKEVTWSQIEVVTMMKHMVFHMLV